jgi:hypothetical protein
MVRASAKKHLILISLAEPTTDSANSMTATKTQRPTEGDILSPDLVRSRRSMVHQMCHLIGLVIVDARERTYVGLSLLLARQHGEILQFAN